jgi:hypothetical protein
VKSYTGTSTDRPAWWEVTKARQGGRRQRAPAPYACCRGTRDWRALQAPQGRARRLEPPSSLKAAPDLQGLDACHHERMVKRGGVVKVVVRRAVPLLLAQGAVEGVLVDDHGCGRGRGIRSHARVWARCAAAWRPSRTGRSRLPAAGGLPARSPQRPARSAQAAASVCATRRPLGRPVRGPCGSAGPSPQLSCRRCMIWLHTVVLPDAVPPSGGRGEGPRQVAALLGIQRAWRALALGTWLRAARATPLARRLARLACLPAAGHGGWAAGG